MAWGSVLTATQLTSFTDSYFDLEPDLEPNESAHVSIDVNFPGSPAEDAIVEVYTRNDGTNWDDSPYLSFVISRLTDPNQRSFPIARVKEFRVRVRRSGASMTFTSADMRVVIGS